jgi:hypothetical protein
MIFSKNANFSDGYGLLIELPTMFIHNFLTTEHPLHCKKSVLKIQEYIHGGANVKFYIPEFFNFKLLIPEYSPI